MVGSLELHSFGALHDVQLDYYGKRAAGAFEDGVVRVWDTRSQEQTEQPKLLAELKGHEGPAWKVSWAHPQFGSVLASCSYDMKIIIWKEVHPGNFQIAHTDSSHTASVNDCQFSPWEYGLRLACVSSDGTLSVLTYDATTAQWRRLSTLAHPAGAQTLSWAPAVVRDGTVAPYSRLVTGGLDNCLSLWKIEGEECVRERTPLAQTHQDWVRAVAWRPTASPMMFASGSWDKVVNIYAQEMEGQAWRQISKITLPGKVEGLAWSVTGSILSVSYGEGESVLYKENYDGNFEELGKVSEAGYVEVPNSVSAKIASSETAIPAAVQAQPPQDAEFVQQQQAVLSAFGM
jgi:protein transport protein SEC13